MWIHSENALSEIARIKPPAMAYWKWISGSSGGCFPNEIREICYNTYVDDVFLCFMRIRHLVIFDLEEKE
jgi:hypothetical protein